MEVKNLMQNKMDASLEDKFLLLLLFRSCRERMYLRIVLKSAEKVAGL